MSDIIAYLKRFNHKERFHLLRLALGDGMWPEDSFQLSPKFIERLNTEFNLAIAADAFAAMDYHLDWIYASLYLAADRKVKTTEKSDNEKILQPRCGVNKNQEDIDLLIAFHEKDHQGAKAMCHLIMIEAKCETGWTNAQIDSKLKHLNDIYKEFDPDFLAGVSFHFVFLSPKNPTIKTAASDEWLSLSGERYHYIEGLKVSGLKITRCDEHGIPSKTGDYWKR
ncbi:MAG: hypothetical protein ACYDBB_04945 [Armatimonadota bacterium]